MMPYTGNTVFNDFSTPDASDTDHVQMLFNRNEVGINSPVNGSPASLWVLRDFDFGDYQNEPTDTATSFLSEPSGSTLTVPMQTISLIPETPTESSAVIPGDAPYHHSEPTILEHLQLDTAGIEDWPPSRSQENEGNSATWTQLFDDLCAGNDNQDSLVTSMNHQSLPPTLEYSHLPTRIIPLSSNSDNGVAAVSFTDYLQVPQVLTSVGERESSPGGLIFGPLFNRAQTPVSNFSGADGRLTPIDTSVEALKHLSQTNEPLPSPGSKRSRQATVDSAETVMQGHCSNPASGSATKPPRKRQKPKDSALVQSDLDPLAIDNAGCSTTEDSEAISRAIQIVQNNRAIRDFVLNWDNFKARHHHHHHDSAILYKYLHPDSHETPGVDLSSGSHNDLQQSQAVYAPTSSQPLPVFEPQREGGMHILYPDALISLSERQIMKQRAADPVTVENAPGPSGSQTSWNAPMPTSLSYNHDAFASTLANIPSSAVSRPNIDCSLFSGTSCHPSPADTYLTTPASSHAPLSADTPADPGLKSILDGSITTSQVGLMTKPVQQEMRLNYELPSQASSSSHTRAVVMLTKSKQPQRQSSSVSNSGMQYGPGKYISRLLSPVRRQTQPTPAAASVGLDTTHIEPMPIVPNSARAKIVTRPNNPTQPLNLILLPQEVKFRRNMKTLLKNLHDPIRFRYEGASWDGIRLSDVASDVNGKYRGPKHRISDSDTIFGTDALPSSVTLRFDWPGYKLVHTQFQVNRVSGGQEHVSFPTTDRQRVLEYTARQVVTAMKELSGQEFNPKPGQEHYKIGTPTGGKRWAEGLSYHDVYLAGITQKSRGKWQPELWLDTSSFGSN